MIADYDNAFGKVTNVLNDRNTLAAGYLFTEVRNGNTAAASPGQGLPSSYRDNRIHDQTAYANLFHLFNTRLASESSVAFGRRIFYMDPVGAGYEPVTTGQPIGGRQKAIESMTIVSRRSSLSCEVLA